MYIRGSRNHAVIR